MNIFYVLCFCFLLYYVEATSYTNSPAFDQSFYDQFLDTELCKKQLDYIQKDVPLLLKFKDRGLRSPKAISEGNLVEFGSYHACLDIQEQIYDESIEGKYCMLKVSLPDDLQLPNFLETAHLKSGEVPFIKVSALSHNEQEKLRNFENFVKKTKVGFQEPNPRGNHERQANKSSNDMSLFALNLGMCLPKVCTSKEALEMLYLNITTVDFKYHEEYCRLPNDKPWTPADTVAMSVIGVIALVTVLSTCYDVYHTHINTKVLKQPNIYLRAFSVYTNTRRLLTVNRIPGAIECIDGIRAFAMAWVILGHTFHAVSAGGYVSNSLEAAEWVKSGKLLWVTSAPVTVDTFFALSGLLVVYTTAGKITGLTFLKNLHMFYLNRLLRLFPILAFCIVLQISVFHRISDGPDWTSVATHVNDCRAMWWSNLLYIQNYYNHYSMCIPHTWYLTVDTQLYFISPVVLYWVLNSKKRQAWSALTLGVIISLTASTVYIFIQKFPLVLATDPEDSLRYNRDYYINTLIRAPPFCVGMIFGYIMHLRRNRKIELTRLQATLIWVSTTCIAATVIYSYFYQVNFSGEVQAIASSINAFTRPAWAIFIGWMILACAHGYGGPINWVLSLKELKLLGRVSYAMYIIHYPIMFAYVGSAESAFRFDILSMLYIFLSHFAASFISGFVITVLVDSPASIFLKLLFSSGMKKKPADSHEDTKITE